jgi:hypothetical protein
VGKKRDRKLARAVAAVEVDAAARGLEVSGSVLDIIADIRARHAAAQRPEPPAPQVFEPAATEKKHSYRYPGDKQLVEEGHRLIGDGITKSEAARRLAPRAEGKQTLGQKESRLRRLF